LENLIEKYPVELSGYAGIYYLSGCDTGGAEKGLEYITSGLILFGKIFNRSMKKLSLYPGAAIAEVLMN